MNLADVEPRVYILLRGDLPPAQRLVQIAHVAMLGQRAFGYPDDPWLIVCELDGVDGIAEAKIRLAKHAIAFDVYEDPDAGLGPAAIVTALLAPAQRNIMRKYTLWGRGSSSVEHPVLNGEVAGSVPALGLGPSCD